jgi:PAS domain S-box-containing protein
MPLETTLPIAGALSILVGAVVLVAGLLARGRLRRAARRIVAQIALLRHHPLVGEIAPESEALLRALTTEINQLLGGLRAQLQGAQARVFDLQAIADGPSDAALLSTDPEWRVTGFSRGASNLTGWTSEEILHNHVEVLFATGEWERILPKLSRRSLRETGIAETVRLQRRDGTTLPARILVETGGAAGGSVSANIISARDLTAELDLEQRLRVSEERYRRMVEGISDGVFILKTSRLVFANPAMARLLGVDRETLQGMPFKDLIHTRDLLRVLEVVRRAETGEEGAGEIACRLLVRELQPVEVRIAWSVAEFQGGRAMVGTVVDLSERTRFERALQSSEALLRATLNSTGDAILVVGESGGRPSVTIVNPTFCELFGMRHEDLAGLPEDELGRHLGERCVDPGALLDLLRRARSGEEARLPGFELRAPRPALVDLLAGPVRSSSGTDLGCILTARDVTERVENERRIARSLEELSVAKSKLEAAYREVADAQQTLAQRNAQLERVNLELKSLDEMKSNLLANVSHELHTPLVSIKGYTEMIVKRRLGPLTAEQERGLTVALRNIDRLIEMIDNLLSFSRLEKGETQLTLEDTPLWQLVDEAIDMVAERIKKKNISVTTQYDSDDLILRGDRGRIGQVLTNLLTNAVKFNREGGSITVTGRRGAQGFIEVEVKDTGIGIPPEEQGRIFERFYQVDSGPGRKYEGTGIGLAIVRDILGLHGCSIRVKSTPGMGSTFSFTLPLARQTQASTTRPPARGQTRD